MNDPIRILVCGSKQAGKTSLINLLTQQETSLDGSKRDINEVSCFKNNRNYIFIDVVGFDLTDKGFFTTTKAVKNLKAFLKQIGTGLNLVIHVIKRQALIETDKVNYEIIVNDIFSRSIKTMCAITFSEDEESLENYWKIHCISLHQRGFMYNHGVAVCCGHSRNKTLDMILKESREISYNLAWKSIQSLMISNEKVMPVLSIFERILGSLNFMGFDSNDNSYTQNTHYDDEYVIVNQNEVRIT
jgi:predicted GTPase